MTADRAIRVAATSARVLTGAAIAAACVVGIVVGVSAPWPTVAGTPAQAEITPQRGDTVVVCNGDFRALGRDTSNPLAMESAGTARFTSDGDAGRPDAVALAVPELAGAGEVRKLSAAVQGDTAPLIGAAESITLTAEDLAGFAAAPCRAASSESWLLGGTVATGSEDLVVLTNPGAVPATVTLTVYGTVRGTSTAIVPPAAQVALPLSSIATGALAPVVKVTTEGSPVRAVLQSSLTQTLDPIGIDLQDAITAPQQHPVIPGVELFPDVSDNSVAAVLRMLSPGVDTTAQVTVRAVGQSRAASTFEVELAADAPTEVGLSNLDPGLYTVYVDAEAAVLAGVRIQDGVAPGSDFAWVMPAPEIAGEVFMAVPSGPAATLYLANDGEADATVTLEPTTPGEPETITVPAGSSASVDLEARTVYSLTSTEAVHATVAMTAPGALAAWPLWPGAAAQQSIVVYP